MASLRHSYSLKGWNKHTLRYEMQTEANHSLEAFNIKRIMQIYCYNVLQITNVCPKENSQFIHQENVPTSS